MKFEELLTRYQIQMDQYAKDIATFKESETDVAARQDTQAKLKGAPGCLGMSVTGPMIANGLWVKCMLASITRALAQMDAI